MQTLSLERKEINITAVANTCSHCGHTGSDVHEHTYANGSGCFSKMDCDNSVECWGRWDKANGFIVTIEETVKFD